MELDSLLRPTLLSTSEDWNYQSDGKLYLRNRGFVTPFDDKKPALSWKKELRIAKHPTQDAYAYASSVNNGYSSIISLYYPFNKTTSKSYHKDKDHGFDYSPAFSPNGEWLAFISEEEYGKIASLANVLIVRYSGDDKVYNLTEDAKIDGNRIHCKEFQWLNDNTILIEYPYQGYTKVGELSFNPKNPQIRQFVELGNFKLDKKVEQGGKIYVKGFHFDTEKGWNISHLSTGIVERCEYTTSDNIQSYYWFAHPAKESNNGRTILLCQGGPHHAWEPEIEAGTYHIPLFQHLGYSVIMPIVRGMPGITPKFDDQIRGDWGGQCINDYLYALDAAINKHNLDSKKVALMGHSFGGFCAYSMNILHPERFCCFVAESGPFNLKSLITEDKKDRNSTILSEMRDGLDNPDGDNVMNKILSQSPAKLINNDSLSNNTKPILIIHGDKDQRVPPCQAKEAKNAFLNSRYKSYKEDGHMIVTNKNKIDRYKQILTFLDNNMGLDHERKWTSYFII